MLVAAGVVVVVFFMLHLTPGDPVALLFGDAPVPKEQVEALRRRLGLDVPIGVQFVRFFARTVRGDLGRSLVTNRPVASDLARVVPHTAQLALGSMLLAAVGGTIFGIISALYRNTWIDNGVTVVALLGISFPSFWTGLLFVWLFAVKLEWFPITGYGSARHLVLPAVTLGWYAGAVLTRLVRSGMLEVLRQDYVTTARAKGVPGTRVVVLHALRNTLIPIVTVLSLQFGTLLSGAVVVETVFARDGIGRMLVNGISQKDFPVVQGAVLVVAIAYSLTNLAADLSYAILDPRVEYG
jgi:ABC-type dipeptide/oligopeptide/nickel transport system permease component